MSKIVTRSGVAFDLVHPRAKDVLLEDIAWALARIPRFTGHTTCTPALSVAHHSLQMLQHFPEERCSTESRLAALLHDAHEAYIGDIATPIAQALGEEVHAAIGTLKERVQRAIHLRVGLEWPNPPQLQQWIHDADRKCFEAETLLWMPPHELFRFGRAVFAVRKYDVYRHTEADTREQFLQAVRYLMGVRHESQWVRRSGHRHSEQSLESSS